MGEQKVINMGESASLSSLSPPKSGPITFSQPEIAATGCPFFNAYPGRVGREQSFFSTILINIYLCDSYLIRVKLCI